jgi:secretion/DNA translocation related CpaE-like protein
VHPRSLVVTSDPEVVDDLVRLAATAGTELDVVTDAGAARARWASAPFVVVAADAAAGCARSRLPRRSGVVLLGDDLDDAGIWQRAVELGAEHVLFLPDAEPWLRARLGDAAEPDGSDGVVVAVLGARGGAGATTLASGLAVTAQRAGHRALLVDADPLGGGIDLVFGAEHDTGLRWPDLVGTRGRVPGSALAAALPSVDGLPVLSWDRGMPTDVPVEAVQSVLLAARRAHDLVVVDLARSLDDAARAVLDTATATLLVVPTEVRAAAAAARTAALAAARCPDLRLVARGPSPSGLTGAEIARALGLPLAAELRGEPALAGALDRGEGPCRRDAGPLATACRRLLADLLPDLEVRAAA